MSAMATPRFELYEKAGWRWRLVDRNGRVIAWSLRYATKAGAKQAAQRTKEMAAAAEVIEIRQDVDVTAVAASAFGAQVDIVIEGLGTITSPPTPAVTLAPAGGSQTKTVPKAKVGPAGIFLASGPLQAACEGALGAAGSASGSARATDVDALGGTLTATSLRSTCTANETGATASTTVTGGMLVLDENRIVALPDTPAPNATYEGVNADTGDTFTVVLNEQTVTADGLQVAAVHVILHGPTATGDIVLASATSGVTAEPA